MFSTSRYRGRHVSDSKLKSERTKEVCTYTYRWTILDGFIVRYNDERVYQKNYIYSIFFNNFTNFYFFRLPTHFVYFVQNSPFISSSNISTLSYQIYFIWIILNFHKHFILFTLSFIFALYFMNLNIASLRIKHCSVFIIYYTYECVFTNT